MIDKETIEKTLDNIFSSKHFSSSFDRKFLKYLIEATLEKRELKEINIAIEIFKRSENFNPADDSIVRSHMYSLRKRLETYYLTDGKADPIKIVVPKGHYKVDFINRMDQKSNLKRSRLKFSYFTLALVIIFAALTIYLSLENSTLHRQIEIHRTANIPISVWSDFLESNLSTLLVLGDYYVFQRPLDSSGRERFIRDVEINSSEDFAKYLENNPSEKGKIEETPLTYFGMEAPHVVNTITKIFHENDSKLNIKFASDLNWQDIQQNNIIFIGSMKTMREMNYFFNQLRFKVSLFPHKVYYTPTYQDTVETISLESYYRYGFHNDYPIVTKFPGSHQNIIMLFVSFSSFGKVETVKKLTHNSFITDLRNLNFINGKDLPQYFEILFRVYGIERSGFNTEIIHFHEIEPDSILDNDNNPKIKSRF